MIVNDGHVKNQKICFRSTQKNIDMKENKITYIIVEQKHSSLRSETKIVIYATRFQLCVRCTNGSKMFLETLG